ncbi:MAG: hypothetical protein AB1403_26560, partial [Candidatus Riflebacteria bacterium]
VSLLLASGCATPPGKLQQSDFVTSTLSMNVPVPNALSAFYEGLRYCGPESGGAIFVTHHGIPECAPVRPDGSAVCDLYLPQMYGGRSNNILGRVDFVPNGTGTTATFSVQSYAAKTDKILAAWKMFAEGNAKQVCPK